MRGGGSGCRSGIDSNHEQPCGKHKQAYGVSAKGRLGRVLWRIGWVSLRRYASQLGSRAEWLGCALKPQALNVGQRSSPYRPALGTHRATPSKQSRVATHQKVPNCTLLVPYRLEAYATLGRETVRCRRQQSSIGILPVGHVAWQRQYRWKKTPPERVSEKGNCDFFQEDHEFLLRSSELSFRNLKFLAGNSVAAGDIKIVARHLTKQLSRALYGLRTL